jgi:hypothetical protein
MVTDWQPPRVFVSYARRDGEAIAADLVERIVSAGISVWRDREGMRGGESWWNQIDLVLDQVEFMVVAMTPGAIDSEVVRKEWDLARRKGVCIFPVLGPGKLPWAQMPSWMRRVHFYDLKHQSTKFINDLNTRCQKIRVPFMVEALPENYVPRKVLYEQVLGSLVREHRSDSKPVVVALRGAGGFGKTTLARAICHDIRTRLAFFDGVLWVSLGQKPQNLAAKVETLIYELSKERPGFTDAADASNRLRELIKEKNVLIVIDDVWREADARPFLVGGKECAWLLTTRVRTTLPSGGAEVPVDEMNQAESSAVLVAGLPSEDSSRLDSEITKLAARLGEWPLLLNLVNRILVDRVKRRGEPLAQALAYATAKLGRQGLLAFDRRDAGEREQAAAVTIAASLDQLDVPAHGDDASDELSAAKPLNRFEELAVFPEDATIPVSVVAQLWAQTSGVDDFVSRELCNRLFDLSLLQSYDLRTQTIRLHDVIWNFLQDRADAESLTRLHQALAESYRGISGGHWEHVADDGYYHEHLMNHLIASGYLNDAHALIGPHWRRAQLERVGSDRAFAADIEAALTEARHEQPPNTFELIRAAYIRASLGTQAARVAPEVLGALSRVGLAPRASGYASLVHDAVRRTHAYCLISKGLVERGERSNALEALAQALDSAHGVERESPRAQALSEVAEAYAFAGDKAAAVRAAKASVQAARESNFEYRMAEDLLAAAHALECAGLNTQAVEVVGEALTKVESEKNSGMKAAICLVTAIKLYRSAGDSERENEAEGKFAAAFNELKKRAAGGGYLDLDRVPDLVKALVRAAALDVAQSVADAWGSSWDWKDVKSLAMIARAHLAGGEKDRAESVVLRLAAIVELWSRKDDEKKEERNQRPDPSDWSVLVDVVQVLAEFGLRNEAMRVCENITEPEQQSAAYGIFAYVIASRETVEAAKEPLARAFAASKQRAVRTSEELHAAASVIKAMLRQGASVQACPIVDLAAQIAKRIDVTDWEGRRALTEFAAAQSAIDPKGALELADLVESPYDKLEMLTQIAAETASGDANDAIGVAMRKFSSQLADDLHLMERAERSAQLAFASSVAGDHAVARKILAELKTRAASPQFDENGRTNALNLAVRTLVKMGDFEEAIDMAGVIPNGRAAEFRIQTDVYNLLVKELLTKGDQSRAQEVAIKAVEAAHRASTIDERDPFKNDILAAVLAAETLLLVGDRMGARAIADRVLADLPSRQPKL